MQKGAWPAARAGAARGGGTGRAGSYRPPAGRERGARRHRARSRGERSPREGREEVAQRVPGLRECPPFVWRVSGLRRTARHNGDKWQYPPRWTPAGPGEGGLSPSLLH